MKKSLLSLLFLMIFVCFQTFSQDARSKSLSGDNDRAAIEITIVGSRVYIENAPIGKKIEVFSVVGLKVYEIEIKNSSGDYTLNVPKGYYILRVNDIVRKIAIR